MVLPETVEHFDLSEYLWNPAVFGVSARKTVSRVRTPGYNVGSRTPDAIQAYLQSEFGIEKSAMRVVPYSGTELDDIGLRVSDHALHATYCRVFENTAEFTGQRRNCRPGWLVPGLSVTKDRCAAA
ncbi:MAG: hypothetical protein QGH15_24105, partial [Kiritimatiellia bacterium]|nr:hypothetical protein [Kiritimatiellia bacterium]